MHSLQRSYAMRNLENLLVWHMSDGGVLCRRPSQPSRSVPVAVQCLARLLREAPARALFTRASGASLLAPLLRSATSGSGAAQAAPSHQLLYEAGLCAWQLTFYHPAAQAMASSRITPALVNLARHAQKEKVGHPLCWLCSAKPCHPTYSSDTVLLSSFCSCQNSILALDEVKQGGALHECACGRW